MKRIILLLIFASVSVCILLSGCEKDAVTTDGTVTVNSYTMDLNLDTEEKTLSGTVDIDFTNDTEDTLDKVIIRYYPASIVGGDNSEIESIIEKDGKLLEFYEGRDLSVITVELDDKGLAKGESETITVTYKTAIPETRDRFGYYQDGDAEYYLLTFCFPMLSMLEDGKWNENPYIYSAESTYSPVTDYKVRFTAPEEFLVAASGDETTENGVTTINAENMRDMAIIASNNMEVTTETAEGIKINNYTIKHPGYEGAKKYNRFTMEAAKDSVKLFTEKIGKYPYDELDVIQCYDEGGMEYPGLVLIGLPDIAPAHKIIQALDTNGSYSDLTLLVAHEVAHQWFYGAVGNDQYEEAWLDEGFAEYCQSGLYCLSQPKSLQQAIAADEEKTRDDVFLLWDSEEGIDTIIPQERSVINKAYDEFYSYDDYSWNVYQNGAYFLYELRKAMGDENFFTMLQEYYKTYCLKEVKSRNFVDMVYQYDRSDQVKRVMKKYIEI